jgi:hypothetical protein
VCCRALNYFFRFVALGERDAPILLFGLSLLFASALLLALLAAAAAAAADATAVTAGARAAVLPRFVRTGLNELLLAALARLSLLADRSALVAARFVEGLLGRGELLLPAATLVAVVAALATAAAAAVELVRLPVALTLLLPTLLPRFVTLRPREPGLTGDLPLVVGVEGRLEPVLPRFPLLLLAAAAAARSRSTSATALLSSSALYILLHSSSWAQRSETVPEK